MPHELRDPFDPRYPVQLTVRSVEGLPSLRTPRSFQAVRRAVARAAKARFRVLHFSVQRDHAHFIVEGDDERSLKSGIRGLVIRLGLAINRSLGRSGTALGDRYHARSLTNPTQMRASMVYVLLNFRKHLHAGPGVDPFSSGPYFWGWRDLPGTARVNAWRAAGYSATARPKTWLANIGWLAAGGPLRLTEQPAT